MNLLLQNRPNNQRTIRIIDNETDEVDALSSSFSSDSIFESTDSVMSSGFSPEETDFFSYFSSSFYSNFSSESVFVKHQLTINPTYFLDYVRSARCFHDHLNNMLVFEVIFDFSWMSSDDSFISSDDFFISSDDFFISSNSSLSGALDNLFDGLFNENYKKIFLLDPIYKWLLELAVQTFHPSIEEHMKVVIKSEQVIVLNRRDLINSIETEGLDYLYSIPASEAILVTWDKGIPYYNEEEILQNI
ncbi:MAG: hypothetical protein ACHQUC_03515 [Chlamydiales bacterium]